MHHTGLPDEPSGLRRSVWRVLLELPVELSEQYSAFVSAVEQAVSSETKHAKVAREVWNDVNRTLGGGLAWFNKPALHVDAEDQLFRLVHAASDENKLLQVPGAASAHSSDDGNDHDSFVTPPATPRSSNTVELAAPDSILLTRRDSLFRPLFVFAVLNPGISYVQGMNSIMAVLAWSFGLDADDKQSLFEAEAAAFFAFGKLVTQVQDLYLAESSNASVKRAMASFVDTLEWADHDVLVALEEKQIDPLLFVFKWLSTLFATEFEMPDVSRLWDRFVALASVDDLANHLVDVAVALTLEERLVITSPYADFSRTLQTLNQPQVDGARVDQLIANAWGTRERRKLKEAGVPEWRITASKWTGTAASTLKERFMSSSDARNDDDDDDTGLVDGETGSSNSWSEWTSSLSNRFAVSDTAAHLAKHRTNLSISASRLATSDAAASISKASTNLSAQASLLSSQIATQAPERLNKIRSNVQAASSRLMASTGSSQSPVRRPGSPTEPPFTPPTHYASPSSSSAAAGAGADSPAMSRRPISPPSSFGPGSGSTLLYDQHLPFSGPKPLLLSPSSSSGSPSMSIDHQSLPPRRTSLTPSPTALRSSISVAPLGRARPQQTAASSNGNERAHSPTETRRASNHRKLGSSSADVYNDANEREDQEREDRDREEQTPIVVPAATFQMRRTSASSSSRQNSSSSFEDSADQDVPISSLRLGISTLSVDHSHDPSPLSAQSSQPGEPLTPASATSTSSRLKRSAARRRSSADYSSAIPSKEGRGGWSLVDKPLPSPAGSNDRDDDPFPASPALERVDERQSHEHAQSGAAMTGVQALRRSSRPHAHSRHSSSASRSVSATSSIVNTNDGTEKEKNTKALDANKDRPRHASRPSVSDVLEDYY